MVALSIACLAAFIVTMVSLAFCLLGVGVLVTPASLWALRRVAQLARTLASWSGVSITAHYLVNPDPRPGVLGWLQHLHHLLTDSATCRDLLWAGLNSVVGFVLGLLPTVILAYAVQGILLPTGLWIPVSHGLLWYGFVPLLNWDYALLGGLLGVAILGSWVYLAPRLILLHAHFCSWLLSIPERSRLRRRVRDLAESRAEVIEIQAAELRRIEADLHDGAQARLLVIGMTIGAAERHLETDTATVRTLLAEARESSTRALAELRDLVYGIYPPVLVERGLGQAIEALVTDSPIPVVLELDLPRRLVAPVESAAYFAVSELFANVVKHADASRLTISLRQHLHWLEIRVTDDGKGGADLLGGNGLRGIQRRCATFDGAFDLDSPIGGPTVVTMELPCGSYLPKTSTS